MRTYLKPAELQKSVDLVNASIAGKPLAIEETFNLQCSTQALEAFLKEIDGRYNGLIGHYFGKTIEGL